ncbi:helix-turn-helix domain-containing protein [Tenacibaculum sp. Mcav3-52]|uniref:helix-turn-helix domain-containing protein n=1 Tax=Tenacibaculum sp. Mcav3-52 TaxID=2917762 RepID=UPI001EF2550F|nr:helix-turn-helix domain-containing protein [Tenacibaculum sp. Mcav3-52]MCG7501771.1 helix-turn-helix domain-containing protein [Tenacibaculum sp. Mcav3-52]
MIQLINITEEKLTTNILLALKKELAQLKKDFQPQESTKWISRKDTAKMLGVSFTTLANWNKKGVLTAYSIGTRVYYKLDEVNNALTPIAC